MYYLTFDNGEFITFYVLSCAEVFQRCYGGTIHYEELLLAA